MKSANEECARYRAIMMGEEDLGDLRQTVPLLDRHDEHCIPCVVWKQSDFRDAPTKVIPRLEPRPQLVGAGRIENYLMDLKQAAMAVVRRLAEPQVASS